MDQSDNSLFKIPCYQPENNSAANIDNTPKNQPSNQERQPKNTNQLIDSDKVYQRIFEIGDQLSKFRNEAIIEMEGR